MIPLTYERARLSVGDFFRYSPAAWVPMRTPPYYLTDFILRGDGMGLHFSPLDGFGDSTASRDIRDRR